MLNGNRYNTTIASDGDQVIGYLEKTWYHLVLMDLDSIDVSDDYLAGKIRKLEPDIPIIALEWHGRCACPEMSYFKKPLSLEIIQKYFSALVIQKESRAENKSLYALILACWLAVIIWIFISFIWKKP
jgi:CheY-like chemotaxis protein